MHTPNRGAWRHLMTASLMLLVLAGASHAATITIVNIDGPGEGFNDPTPVAPIGGNPGTTIGEQRLFVFNHAAAIWGAILPSSVEIRVRAQFSPQDCTTSGAVLGGTSAVSDRVLRALRSYTSGGVSRIAGADRYATAAAVSRAHFKAGVAVAYLATGQNFPDALSGSAAAGSRGGPVLLVNRDGIPSATATELARLKPGRIILLGSGSAISDRVRTAAARYTNGSVSRLAGAGGMGRVYEARDRFAGGSVVALKVLLNRGLQESERFMREACVLAGISHPGVVRYVAHGATGGGDPYLVMEWLTGETLSERLRRTGIGGVPESVALVRQLALALGQGLEQPPEPSVSVAGIGRHRSLAGRAAGGVPVSGVLPSIRGFTRYRDRRDQATPTRHEESQAQTYRRGREHCQTEAERKLPPGP